MTASFWLLVAWIAAIALCDVARLRAPNALTLGGAGVGVLTLVATGRSLLGDDAVWTLAVAGAVALAGLFLFELGLVGAGDVKLVFALALLTGPSLVGHGLLVGSVLWGVLSACLLLAERFGLHIDRDRGGRRERVVPLALPYGVGFALVVACG